MTLGKYHMKIQQCGAWGKIAGDVETIKRELAKKYENMDLEVNKDPVYTGNLEVRIFKDDSSEYEWAW